MQNAANSTYNAFQATVRSTKGPVTLIAAYTYSHSIDDSSDRSDATFVNSFDLAANRASSNFDQRHLLNVGYVIKDPFMMISRLYNSIFTPGGVFGLPSQPEPEAASTAGRSSQGWATRRPNSTSDDTARGSEEQIARRLRAHASRGAELLARGLLGVGAVGCS